MKTLIIVLIIAAFLQTTVLPIDLILLILVCRTYLRSEKVNLYLAFVFGLLVSHLNLTSWGFDSLIYLGVVLGTQMLSKLRLAANPLLVVPISFIFLFLSKLANLSSGSTIDLPKLILAALLSLPAFYLIRIWEERFIVQKEIKLKI